MDGYYLGEIMELTILKQTKNEINIRVAGETHTLLNLLKTALLNNKHVEIATYDIKHPTISEPVLFVRQTRRPHRCDKKSFEGTYQGMQ